MKVLLILAVILASTFFTIAAKKQAKIDQLNEIHSIVFEMKTYGESSDKAIYKIQNEMLPDISLADFESPKLSECQIGLKNNKLAIDYSKMEGKSRPYKILFVKHSLAHCTQAKG